MAADSELLKQHAYQQTASGCEGKVEGEETRRLAQIEASLSPLNVEMAIEWAHLGGD